MVTTLQADRITAINHIFLMCRSGPSWTDILEAVSEPAALNGGDAESELSYSL